jgi:CspA family cold shock protein
LLPDAFFFAVYAWAYQNPCAFSVEERRMATGTVTWFNTQKGFGFIQPESGGKVVFVHVTAVQAAGLHTLDEGQRVTYEVVAERGKEAAANLWLA